MECHWYMKWHPWTLSMHKKDLSTSTQMFISKLELRYLSPTVFMKKMYSVDSLVKKHCFRNCLKSILNQIKLQRNENCHQHNLPVNWYGNVVSKSHPDVCGEVCHVSDQPSCWPGTILNRILYPKSWQVLFPPKMTRLLIYFLLLCFLSELHPQYPLIPNL